MELKKYKLGELLSKIENGAVIKQNKGAKGIPITRIETRFPVWVRKKTIMFSLAKRAKSNMQLRLQRK